MRTESTRENENFTAKASGVLAAGKSVQNMPGKRSAGSGCTHSQSMAIGARQKSTLLKMGTPEETASCVLSDSSQEPDNKISLVVFRLVYLPTRISEKDVVNKLSQFGTVTDFEFVPVRPEEVLLEESKAENFRCAQFSFKETNVTSSFSTVKRIRVKGLQVRVVINSDETSSGQGTTNIMHCKVKHVHRPTSKLYYRNRVPQPLSLPESAEENYFWRIAIPRFQ